MTLLGHVLENAKKDKKSPPVGVRLYQHQYEKIQEIVKETRSAESTVIRVLIEQALQLYDKEKQ